MVHHKKEPVLLAGLVDEPGRVGDGVWVTGEEPPQVNGRDIELWRRAQAGLLVVRPYVLGWYVVLVLEDGGVEGERLWFFVCWHG